MSAHCRICGTPVYDFASQTKPKLVYEVCPSCGFTRLKETFALSCEDEKKRYLLHTNSKADKGYMNWLSVFIDTAVKPILVQSAPGIRILDFGSGPVPVLAELLEKLGYSISIYDPYFAPDTAVLHATYTMIILHEVIEHLAEPHVYLKELLPILEHNGYFAMRTQFRPQCDSDFDSFWYRKDPTHRSFFTKQACTLLAEQLTCTMSILDKDIVLMKKL